MSTSDPRTLADQLRTWSAEQLEALLVARPDLGVPPPQDSAQLASRAATRPAVLRALDDLSVLDLAVLDTVLNEGPVAHDRVLELVPAAGAEDSLAQLRVRLLVWGPDEALRTVTVLGEVVGLPPGPPPDRVTALLGEVDDRARTILDHLDEAGVDGRVDAVPARLTPESASTPTEQLLARRLLVQRDARHVTVPWSVRLVLRSGFALRPEQGEPPALALTDRDASAVDHAAAGAAFEVVRRTELLLDRWGTTPPGALRGGGLGVRDLRAAAVLLHVDATVAALVVETAAEAGLVAVGMTDDSDAAWLPTDEFDRWLARDPAERWAVLAAAWLGSLRLSGLVGSRVADKPVNALAEGTERTWAPAVRRETLAELAGATPGSTLAATTGLPSLVERLRWRRPRRPASREHAVGWAVQEAGQLGLAGLGGVADFARVLLAGGDPVPLLEPLLPQPVDHVLVQADLTAIAPGPLEGELARRLGLVADVESSGGATVYRFAATSVRRAFDAGWTTAEVHDFVSSVSRTPVPQSLSYLIDDVARRFGTLRAGHAECFLRSDDETALTELLHDPGAGPLRLRRIAPTVVVSDLPLGQLLPKLRTLGAAPVVEAADGTVQVARRDVSRARTPRRRTGASAQAREGARTAAVVSAVRAGDRAAASRPISATVSSPAEVLVLLREAVDAAQPVLIGYVGNDGGVGERVVVPRSVEGGSLTAYDERSDDTRTFAVHRITRASRQA